MSSIHKYKKYKTITKTTALICLAVLFSTNFFGGNALYMLSEGAQSTVKIIALTIAIISISIYVLLCIKYKSMFYDIDGILFSKEAFAFLKKNNIPTDPISEVIRNGAKEPSAQGAKCTWKNPDGGKVLIYVDGNSRVTEIVS